MASVFPAIPSIASALSAPADFHSSVKALFKKNNPDRLATAIHLISIPFQTSYSILSILSIAHRIFSLATPVCRFTPICGMIVCCLETLVETTTMTKQLLFLSKIRFKDVDTVFKTIQENYFSLSAVEKEKIEKSSSAEEKTALRNLYLDIKEKELKARIGSRATEEFKKVMGEAPSSEVKTRIIERIKTQVNKKLFLQSFGVVTILVSLIGFAILLAGITSGVLFGAALACLFGAFAIGVTKYALSKYFYENEGWKVDFSPLKQQIASFFTKANP